MPMRGSVGMWLAELSGNPVFLVVFQSCSDASTFFISDAIRAKSLGFVIQATAKVVLLYIIFLNPCENPKLHFAPLAWEASSRELMHLARVWSLLGSLGLWRTPGKARVWERRADPGSMYLWIISDWIWTPGLKSGSIIVTVESISTNSLHSL